jgi:hypothetical protein
MNNELCLLLLADTLFTTSPTVQQCNAHKIERRDEVSTALQFSASQSRVSRFSQG